MALKIVRWQGILEIGAKRKLLAEDPRAEAPEPVCWPRILVTGLFAGQGSSGFALSFACRGSWKLALKGLLADGAVVGSWKLALMVMVVCWPRISRLALYYNKSFAGRGSSRLALKVVC